MRYNDDLLRRFVFMSGNYRIFRYVMLVFTIIAGGINISIIKCSNIIAIIYLLKLLANIIGR